MSDGKPTGLVANKGLELITWKTPNGHKISILLEELKEVYGKDYTFQGLDIGTDIQKEPWYTKLCPNGRIPVLVDHDRNSFPVFEGSAILAYLTRFYDPEHHFSFSDPDDFSRAEQWVAWQHGGLGPMQGQSNHFYRLAKERIPYPTMRYTGEAERLYGVLETQLDGRDWLVGPGKGKYSIADIANFSWVNWSRYAGVDVRKFTRLSAWVDRINARSAVKKGLAIPAQSTSHNAAYEERLKTDSEAADKENSLADKREKAREQYSWKFATP